MIWLTWRQFRAQTIVTSAALAVVGVVLAATGLHLMHLFDASGVATCHAHGNCATLADKFINLFKAGAANSSLFYGSIGVLYLAPALIGVFWGAPLVAREIEAGTFRLAWNQSVTRTRWLAVKLGLTGLAAMATAGMLSLAVTWWAGPIDQALQFNSSPEGAGLTRLAPEVFGARGIAPVGYAVLALAIGVTAGVLIRRTIPAMATTLAAYAGVLLAWPNWIRPHLITPLRSIVPLNPAAINGVMTPNNTQMTVIAAANKPGAWIISNQTIAPSGHLFTGPATQACLSRTASFQACQASIGRLHLRQLISYQPASRFWAFQWYEAGIFLTLALALAGFCFWWIRRRLT